MKTNHKRSASTTNQYEEIVVKYISIQPKQTSQQKTNKRITQKPKCLKDLLSANLKQRQDFDQLKVIEKENKKINELKKEITRSNSRDTDRNRSVKSITPKKNSETNTPHLSKIQTLEDIIRKKIKKHENKESYRKDLSNNTPTSISNVSNSTPTQNKK